MRRSYNSFMNTHPDADSHFSPHLIDINFGEMKSKRKKQNKEPEVGRDRDGLTPSDILRKAEETRRKMEEHKKRTRPPTVIVNPNAKPDKAGPVNPDGSGLGSKDQG